ncbi:MAG: hypothetical protein R3F60_25795 [bacterium]
MRFSARSDETVAPHALAVRAAPDDALVGLRFVPLADDATSAWLGLPVATPRAAHPARLLPSFPRREETTDS